MNSKERSLFLTYAFIDLALLNLSMFVAYYFDFGVIRSSQHPIIYYLVQNNLAWILTYFLLSSSSSVLYLRHPYQHHVLKIFRRVAYFFFLLMGLTFFFMSGLVARQYIALTSVMFFVLELVAYWVIYIVMHSRRKRGFSTKKMLFIGYTDTSVQLRTLIETNPMMGYKFVGYVKYDARNMDEIPAADRPFILGNTSELEQIIKDNGIDTAFSVSSSHQTKAGANAHLAICNRTGIRLYIVAEDKRWLDKNEDIETLGEFYILNPQRIPLDDLAKRWGKRAFDVFFSSLVLLLFCWNVLPIIILIIKWTSKGPVFFVQNRTGLNSVTFPCYKFRSMRVNKDSDKRQATADDDRITPFGRFMRKWNVDELPQFFNVLCGQMSVVGPRPHMLKHTEQYSELVRHYMVRHYVKPGITGWAQVSGLRGETDELWKMEQRVKYDMDYIENWTFTWDLKIIWLTIFGHESKKNAG